MSDEMPQVNVLTCCIIYRYRGSAGGLSQFGESEQTVLAGLKDTFHKINENSDSFPPFFLVQVRFFPRNYRYSIIYFILLNFATKVGTPQHHIRITVGPHYLTHPVRFPCGKRPDYLGKITTFGRTLTYFTVCSEFPTERAPAIFKEVVLPFRRLMLIDLRLDNNVVQTPRKL